MHALRICVVASLSVALVACAPKDDPSAVPEPDAAVPDANVPDANAPDAPEGSFTVTLAEDKLPILQGTSAELAVHIERHEGFAEPIRITAADLPSGVSMAEVLVAEDATEATLELRAATSAPHSLPTAVMLVGSAPSASDDGSSTVTVYGPPGLLDTRDQLNEVQDT